MKKKFKDITGRDIVIRQFSRKECDWCCEVYKDSALKCPGCGVRNLDKKKSSFTNPYSTRPSEE